ncbi:MAG: YebC/PmpR family DNA-binding transcriptional regulator [Phycisphaeraceae bacterium]|nr:YebC/PmpR family DNA-binding transcriptional regulator [Phycisphaeraceae bacterium]
MAGHSHWANIKYKKAARDAKRGKAWSKCARAIIVAARTGGGDPAQNITLRYAIDDAKAVNMPRDTIENAIKKGTGDLEGVVYESTLYEGYGPAGVAVMMEILTDNRNRTAGEIRKIFERCGGNLGSTGCVAYLFSSKGQVFVAKSGAEEEKVMETALEAGAEDVTDEGETWQVLSEPTDFIAVRDALKAAGFTMESSGINMIPATTVQLDSHDAQKVLKLVEALEDHDDVQKVHANFDIPDDVLASLES